MGLVSIQMVIKANIVDEIIWGTVESEKEEGGP